MIDLPATAVTKRVKHASGGNDNAVNANTKANRKSPIGWKALFIGGRGRAKSQRRTASDLKVIKLPNCFSPRPKETLDLHVALNGVLAVARSVNICDTRSALRLTPAVIEYGRSVRSIVDAILAPY